MTVALVFTIGLLILAGGILINTNHSLGDQESSATTSDEDYESAKACFENLNNKLIEINDIVSLAGDSYDDQAEALSSIESIADGGTLSSLSDGTSCPSI